MTSIAVNTAAVPAIVCSSAYRSNDGGTRRHPSGTGPGFLRNAGTSLGVMRNRAFPMTSPARTGPASSPALDEIRSILRSVTVKNLPERSDRPSQSYLRGKIRKLRDLRTTSRQLRKQRRFRVMPSEAIGTNHLAPESIFSIMLFQSHSRHEDGRQEAEERSKAVRRPCATSGSSTVLCLRSSVFRHVRRRHDRALPDG